MAAGTPTTSPLETKTVLMVSIGAAVFAVALGIFEWRTAPLRSETARLLGLELAAESKAFCEKHGMPATPQGLQICTADLQLIRDKQSERMSRDMSFGL